MTPHHITRTMAGIAAFLALAAAWWFLAPTQIGGRTSYATISGTSMEPGLSGGDLAVTRAQSAYEVGDAVLYGSEQLDAPVLHRIVSVDGDAFVLRGDNRTVDDPETPAADQIVGRLWFSLPYLGRAAAVARQPVYLAAFFFLIAFLVLAGGREVSKRRLSAGTPPVRPQPPLAPGTARLAGVARTGFTIGVVGAVLFGAVAFLAWSSSPTRERSTSGGYAHAGSFAYSADVPRSPVYPTGWVTTGETAFTKIVQTLDVTFHYRLDSAHRADAQGGIALDAVVSDRAGWERTIPLQPMHAFTGSAATAEGVLDLRRVGALTEQMRRLTGSPTTTFSVDIVPRVTVVGYAGATVLDEEFSPTLPFTLDLASLRLEADDPEGALAPVQDGEVVDTVSTRVGLGALSLPTPDARSFASLGLVVFLALVAGSALVLARGLAGSGPEHVAARYAGKIVDAHAVVPDGRWVSDVDDMESLVRIATLYDRVVLHVAEEGTHTYLVDDGVGVYRHRLGAGPVSRSLSPLPGAR